MKVHLREDGGIELYDFSAAEAFKIAIKLEKEGMEFYQLILDNTTDEKIKGGLKFFLEEEKKHLDFFEEALGKAQIEEVDGFEEDDIVQYMNSGIFKRFGKLKTNPQSLLKELAKTLKLGMLLESDSVNFYQEVLKNTEDEKGREALVIIIEEEKKHQEQLSRLLKYQEGIVA